MLQIFSQDIVSAGDDIFVLKGKFWVISFLDFLKNYENSLEIKSKCRRLPDFKLAVFLFKLIFAMRLHFLYLQHRCKKFDKK